MKRTAIPVLLLVFLTVTASSTKRSALAQRKSGANNPSQSSSSTDAKKGLDAFNHAFIDACRNMNNEAAAQLWADDGVDLLPGMEPMVGKPEISQWLMGLGEKMKGVKVLQCDVDWRETHVAGDVAYEWGINTQTNLSPRPSRSSQKQRQNHSDPSKAE